MLEWFKVFWCRKMHAEAMWPIHGRYICPQCFREYPVTWGAEPHPAVEHPAVAKEQVRVRSAASI
jgi:hypothetical protein